MVHHQLALSVCGMETGHAVKEADMEEVWWDLFWALASSAVKSVMLMRTMLSCFGIGRTAARDIEGMEDVS